MTNQELLLDALEKGLTELEHEIDGLLKAKKPETVEDDWSANTDDDDGDDTGDNLDDDDAEDLDNRLAKATKFEAMVDKIAAERGLSKPQAMVIVRRDYPDIFSGYQDSGNVSKSYSDLVAAEISKGNSEIVARQKVAAAYPDLARQSLAKGAASPAAFMAKVDAAMQAHGLSRTEAMSQVRKQQPELFRKFQNV